MSGEQGTSTEGTPAEGTAVPSTPEAAPAGPIDYVVSDQGLPTVTDAELMGEDQDDLTVFPADETKKPDETPPADETKKPEETKPETPPKGFVPTAAVHEAREEIRRLKDRLSEYEVAGKKAEVPPVDVPTVRSDFKVLSKEEFAELSEESPRDALIYQQELMDYREVKRIAADSARQAEAERVKAEIEVGSLFEETAAIMADAVPGLFEEGSTVQQELTEFAETVGFTKDLFYLTNPGTQVILPGDTKPLYLGRQAATILTMIANLKSKGLPNADAALKASVEAELRPKIEQEVLSKIKGTGKKPAYKSLSDIPSSDTSTPERKMLSEAEVAAMNPKELEAYLSGA